MSLHYDQIQTEVIALEAIIVTSNSVLDVITVKQHLKQRLQRVTQSSDRAIILRRLLTQSESFQQFLSEKLATSRDIRATGLLDICAWLVAFYKQNMLTSDRKMSQTNNLQKALEVSIEEKLRDGRLSAITETPYEILIKLYSCVPFVWLPPVTLITAMLIPQLILSPGLQAVQRTWHSYEIKCKIFAKILTDQILDNAIIKESLQFGENIHYYTFYSINTPVDFNAHEENEGRHNIFVGRSPDNEQQLCYETFYSSGRKYIDLAELIDIFGEKRVNTLFAALDLVNHSDFSINDENIILAPIILKGHAHYPDSLREGDKKLFKEIVWDSITKLKDPARRLTGLRNLLNGEHPLCQLMDIPRSEPFYSSPSQPYMNRTNQGTRKGILDYIQDAETGCVSKFLSEESSSKPKSLEKILHLYDLNQYIVKLNKMLRKYKIGKKIDAKREEQIIRIRTKIREVSQIFTDASHDLNPKDALVSLILLVNQEKKNAQEDHNRLSINFKRNSQFSDYIFTLNERDFKNRFSWGWTPEVAYLFLQLANSFIKSSKNIDPLPLCVIIEISSFLTGLDENQIGSLWKQYCKFNPQSPAVQKLSGEGRWNVGMFPNISTSKTEGLSNTAHLIFDETAQNMILGG